MPNPGPATTVTPVTLYGGSAADGVALGEVGGEVGFYGVTPVVRASAITPLTNTATGTEIATAVNAINTALKNLGLIA